MQLSCGGKKRGGEKHPLHSNLCKSDRLEQTADCSIYRRRGGYCHIAEDEDGTPTADHLLRPCQAQQRGHQ